MQDEIIKFCQSLIQVRSVNPPGNEKEAARLIASKLEENEIRIDVLDYTNDRGNLIATLGGSTKTPKLLFNGHLDVVPVPPGEKWKMDPFSGGIKFKKIWGRGAVDCKGNVAAMIMAVIVLKQLKIPLQGSLILNFVSDEEQGGVYGIKWCIENHADILKADATIIGEPSCYPGLPVGILIGEKGIFWLEITVWGKSSHASIPNKENNSILKMLKILQALDEQLEYEVETKYSISDLKEMLSAGFAKEHFSRIYEEQRGVQALANALVKLTHAVTIIKAGQKENVVPETCTSLIDFRLLFNHDSQELLNRIKKIISNLGSDFNLKESEDDKRGNVLLKIKADHAASLLQNTDSPIIQVIKDAHLEVFQKPTFTLLMPATTDARYFRNDNPRECSIPCLCPNTVIFGGGSGVSAHSKNENLPIKDLLAMTKVYALIAVKFLS